MRGAPVQSIEGGVASSTVTSVVHESGDPPSALAVHVTVVVPTGKPAAGASLAGSPIAPPSQEAITVGGASATAVRAAVHAAVTAGAHAIIGAPETR
ncbi:MAG: hypothetical protein M5U28_04185 [Sandaracinaceae bacterium]|nr:hypothetical protein [Sandaracinaceae bacterium]